MAGKQDLTEDEFDRWLSPLSVCAVLKECLGTDVWRPLLLKRIEDEEAFAAARKAIYRPGTSREETYYRERLPREYWKRDGPAYVHHGFWSTGDIILTVRRRHHSDSDIRISCVDVRFDPEGIAKLIPRIVTALPSAPRPIPGYRARSSKPPQQSQRVPFEELRDWFTGYSKGRADFRAGVVLSDARKHFHPRIVGRQPIRNVIGEFGKTESRGKRRVS